MFRNKQSYPKELRERARELRRAGLTYSEIIAELGGNIPKPTLQGWVADIRLTTEQQDHIGEKRRRASLGSWHLLGEWNRDQKCKRLQAAKNAAMPIAKQLAQDRGALMLMASALYMGEGSKSEDSFSFGNSDPRIVRTWMALLRRNFDIDESKFACQLAISEGMDEQELRQYWSDVTGIPFNQFIRTSVRHKPSEKKREGYKGVCIVHYYSLVVRRLLDALADGVIGELIQNI
jgi:hypothetical protein